MPREIKKAMITRTGPAIHHLSSKHGGLTLTTGIGVGVGVGARDSASAEESLILDSTANGTNIDSTANATD